MVCSVVVEINSVVVASVEVNIVDVKLVVELSVSTIVDVSDKNWIDDSVLVWKKSNWNGSKSSLNRSSACSCCWDGDGVSSKFG